MLKKDNIVYYIFVLGLITIIAIWFVLAIQYEAKV